MKNIFEEEKLYLDNVKELIKKQEDYHKKELLEIPGRYTNVLQGETILVEILMSEQATKLRRLEMAENSPYFGRIDFYSNNDDLTEKIYIGKTNVYSKDNNLAVTDWRAPVCSLYYDSELGKANYMSPSGVIDGELKLKRQILITDGNLVSAVDTTSINNDELLRPYLSENADNKMKTIVASIQKEQNQIIRRTINESVIVQGVAGSGKTSVALHRIAYLLYFMSEKVNAKQFLVIGPNNYFLNYVSSILPELDTNPVDQFTFLDLLNSISHEKLILVNSETDSNINKYKSSLEFKKDIDSFIDDYLKYDIVSEAFKLDGEVVYTVDEIKNILFSANSKIPNFEKAVNYFTNNFKNNINRIFEKINKKYREIYLKLPQSDPKRLEVIDKSDILNNLVRKDGLKLLKKYFKDLNLDSLKVYKKFILNCEKYLHGLCEEDIVKLKESTLSLINKKRILISDVPALIHLNHIISNNGSNRYIHIVIDEAQDYGLFHFDALKEYYPRCTFSIYGDLAQAINNDVGIKSWEELINKVFNDNCSLLTLEKSYRTTIEITMFANKILKCLNLNEAKPVIRHGDKVETINKANDIDYIIKILEDFSNKKYNTVAIICKTEKECKNIYREITKRGIDINLIGDEDKEYYGGLCVLTSYQAKGLEFDAVIISDASSNIYDKNSSLDMRLLYVACTRALHKLIVLYEKDIVDILNS